MTTNVIITTHDWPVQASPRRASSILESDGPDTIVPPHSTQTIALWQERQLIITELPKPDAK